MLLKIFRIFIRLRPRLKNIHKKEGSSEQKKLDMSFNIEKKLLPLPYKPKDIT